MQPDLTLSNDTLAVTVAPDFGARVTGLVDLRNGRNWLVSGPKCGNRDDTAVFGAAEANGWDECFPTVAPCDSAEWARALRDHGDIWGRKTDCCATDHSLTFAYCDDRFKFQRKLHLNGAFLDIEYQVENTGVDQFPYLWSQHCLLATTPTDRLFMDGAETFNVTGFIGGDAPAEFKWPNLSTQHPDLQTIEPITAGWAIKAYAPVAKAIRTGVHGETGSISFVWSGSQVPYVGLWLDYGAWPDDGPVHQIAIESTTAPADHLAGALASDTARWLASGEQHRWSMSIHLTNHTHTEATQ